MISHLEPGLGDITFPILDIVPADNIPQIGSVFSFTVTSWSMFPTIRQGDVLTIESPNRIRLGDVVVFALSGMLVCHRVTSMQAAGVLRTRGDAASREDAPIRLGDVIGRVTAVRRGALQFVPAPLPTQATLADRVRLQMALLRASLGERLLGWALNILARLKRTQPVRAVARFLLARHVRFYLGIRVPLQFVQAYRFLPVANAAHDDRTSDQSPPDCRNGDDVVIQARLGRLRLGTWHPSSGAMRIRQAAAGLGLEGALQAAYRRLSVPHPAQMHHSPTPASAGR